MRDGAEPGDADGDGARSLARQRGEFARRIDVHRRVHHQHGRVEHRHADRREILDRVVRKIAAQRRIDRDRAHGGEEQRVTVGLRLRHVFGPDRAVGAWSVVDDHGLPEQVPQPFGEKACDEIGGAAGSESDDQTNRPVGIILRLRASQRGQHERGGDQHGKAVADDDHGADHNAGSCDGHCRPRARLRRPMFLTLRMAAGRSSAHPPMPARSDIGAANAPRLT
jgi:hypothetical protein